MRLPCDTCINNAIFNNVFLWYLIWFCKKNLFKSRTLSRRNNYQQNRISLGYQDCYCGLYIALRISSLKTFRLLRLFHVWLGIPSFLLLLPWKLWSLKKSKSFLFRICKEASMSSWGI